MKKQAIKNLKLNKKSISNFKNEKITGGLNKTNPLATACSAGCSFDCTVPITCQFTC
ncbi:hypothetical protein H2O64_05620 [Kordia sp. YSTF-M3]|uniref:Uncharacterized protein n=1 Tax=Kordia aestuariivivens TaxID=2759037 RepID=A0ABR7Q6G8_9FLAO|nr:hypothetical protein [Kordia aestuariivivens]MBC8754140.1 hypothetical protein [Kordia aestuariivivens]